MTATLLILAAMVLPSDNEDHLSTTTRRDVNRLVLKLNADIERANQRDDYEASAAAGRLLTGIQRSLVGGYVGIDIPIVGRYRCFHDKNWSFEFNQYGAHREMFKGGFHDWKPIASGEGWAEYRHPDTKKHPGLTRQFQAIGNGVVIVRDYSHGVPARSFIIEKDNN